MQPANTRKSEIVHGFIVPPTHLELIAVDHCNITCAGCNHASPAMPAWFAHPDAVYRDFSALAKIYRPGYIKLLGGEPLMHKNLPALIDAVRAAGMDCPIVLITNGTLLHTASDALWEGVDAIEISAYAGATGLDDNIRLATERMAALGKRLDVFHYDNFRATYSLQGTRDEELVRKIYATCKVAHYWACHAVRDGYFYKCPRSIYAGRLTGGVAETDRIALTDRPSLQAELLDYVNSPEPLAACTHCVGTVGLLHPHSLPARADWSATIEAGSEALVDFDALDASLLDLDDHGSAALRRKAPGTAVRVAPPLKRLLDRLRGKSRDSA